MFSAHFATRNDAFAEREASETARILRETADKIERGHLEGSVFDANGNKVGLFSLSPPKVKG